MALAFDDIMLARVMDAASLLPVNARDGFMRSVANRISDLRHPPGMAELEQAISFVLGCRGIGGGFQAFNHTRPQDQVVARIRAECQFQSRSSL
jgi:hypothetical protein